MSEYAKKVDTLVKEAKAINHEVEVIEKNYMSDQAICSCDEQAYQQVSGCYGLLCAIRT